MHRVLIALLSLYLGFFASYFLIQLYAIVWEYLNGRGMGVGSMVLIAPLMVFTVIFAFVFYVVILRLRKN